jgi:hypothetical protein
MHADLLVVHMEIEQMRKAMVRKAEMYGHSHPLVLAYSKRLDKLLVRFEQLKRVA